MLRPVFQVTSTVPPASSIGPPSSLTTAPASPGFDIVLNFTGGLTPSQQAAFTQAEATWEGIITGYQGSISIAQVNIDASGTPIDGVGGTLGSAGPTMGDVQGGFLLATDGIMNFDTADLANLQSNGTLQSVVEHEMAHVLGFGTLWDGPAIGFPGTQQVSVDGTGQYTGANALAEWQTEFSQSGATFVPVEQCCGSGTADGHWDEVNFGAGPTGITDAFGRDFARELMTGFLNSPTFISDTSIQSLSDIGFTVIELNPEALASFSPSAGSTIDFGPVRIGDSAGQAVAVENTGDTASDLSGTFGDAGGEFSRLGAQAFGPLQPGDAPESRTYRFAPIDRGSENQNIDINTDGGNATLTLAGDGVGPQFDSSAGTSGTLDFGSVVAGGSGALGLDLMNVSIDDDGGLSALTDLTINDIQITGVDAALFSLSGFAPGDVLSQGDVQNLTLGFQPLFPGVFSATLEILTDEDAPLAAAGNSFFFTLAGTSFAPAQIIPEPSTGLMLLLGLVPVMRRTRR